MVSAGFCFNQTVDFSSRRGDHNTSTTFFCPFGVRFSLASLFHPTQIILALICPFNALKTLAVSSDDRRVLEEHNDFYSRRRIDLRLE